MSSGVHPHAAASASTSEAIARLLMSTPLGGPVVPEVYITIAVESGGGSAYRCHDRACNRTGTCGRPSGSAGTSPSHARAPESVRMWRRSAAPTSAGTGTTGTPAMRQPVIASTVAAVGVASTATLPAPAMRSATEVAAPTRSLRLSVAPSMRTASATSCPPATMDGFREASST